MPITITVMGIFVFGLARYQAFIKEQCLETTKNFDFRYHLG